MHRLPVIVLLAIGGLAVGVAADASTKDFRRSRGGGPDAPA